MHIYILDIAATKFALMGNNVLCINTFEEIRKQRKMRSIFLFMEVVHRRGGAYVYQYIYLNRTD